MNNELLNFEYPEDLVAVAPQSPSRILWSAPNSVPAELDKQQLFNKLGPNDVIVINDTKVLKRRVLSESGLEGLFVEQHSADEWSVLFPAKKLKIGDDVQLPAGQSFTLVEKGIPQKIKTKTPLTEQYFEKHGELALPPYIEKRRQKR